VQITLTITEVGNPIYQVFYGIKRPSESDQLQQLNEKISTFLENFFSNWTVHYIQSDKRFTEIYNDLLLPSIKLEIAESLSTVYETVKRSISSVNDELNRYMHEIGLSDFSLVLTAPENVSDLIHNIKFNLKDEIESELDTKGMGIQAIAVTASMLWLQRFYRKAHRSVIWLIEEPESYLHPNIMSAQAKILTKLSEDSTVIYATHALSFIPNDVKAIVGLEKNAKITRVILYKTARAAIELIRRALGSKLRDYFVLPEYAGVGVEGITDKQYFQWFLSLYNEKVAAEDHKWPLLRKANFIEYGGATNLERYVHSFYEYIRKEVPYVVVFDSDEAGTKARLSLQSIFGELKMRFESGKDFISIRRGYSIEGLFSDKIIEDIHKRGKVIHSFSKDSEGEIEPFRVADDKQKAFEIFTSRAEEEKDFLWARRFINVCSAIESALVYQQQHIEHLSG
jgi:energy-coupling factor transporter ATP-binding protein EcfA2